MKLEAKGWRLETEGNLLERGVDALLNLVPGRTVVSIANAKR